jgi:hypothetical protein
VVIDVAEIGTHLRGDQRRVALDQATQRAGQGHHRPAPLDDLPLHQVQLFGADRAARGEHDRLDLVDVALERIGHREVGVHDLVGDRVQHRGRTDGQPVRVGLQLGAQVAQTGVLTVADGDDEVRAENDMISPDSTISLAVVGDSWGT